MKIEEIQEVGVRWNTRAPSHPRLPHPSVFEGWALRTPALVTALIGKHPATSPEFSHSWQGANSVLGFRIKKSRRWDRHRSTESECLLCGAGQSSASVRSGSTLARVRSRGSDDCARTKPPPQWWAANASGPSCPVEASCPVLCHQILRRCRIGCSGQSQCRDRPSRFGASFSAAGASVRA